MTTTDDDAWLRLVAAALDQPQPTPALRTTLNEVLTRLGHSARLRSAGD